MDVYSVFARIMKFIIISDDMLFPDSSLFSSAFTQSVVNLCLGCIVALFMIIGFMIIDYFWDYVKCSKKF